MAWLLVVAVSLTAFSAPTASLVASRSSMGSLAFRGIGQAMAKLATKSQALTPSSRSPSRTGSKSRTKGEPGPPLVDAPSAPNPALPGSAALFGAFVAVNAEHTGSTEKEAQESFEAMVGRKMAVDKEGYAWDDDWPSAYAYWSRDQGRIVTFEWNAELYDRSYIRWADIADGKYDSIIDAKASAIKAYKSPAFFVFHHEPENDVGGAGTAQDFVDAYQHVHDRFVADGVKNLKYLWVLMAFTFRMGNADQYYPGDQYVDFIGADGYNYYQCPGHTSDWTSFADIFSSFHDYGVVHGKHLFVNEWGSQEDPAVTGRKAQWITDAAATIKNWPEVKVATYYDNEGQCVWWVDSSTSSLAAFQAMGADPYFNPAFRSPKPTKVGAYASVVDSAFSYPIGTLGQGKGVDWLFFGPSTHSVTENHGMGLFDSGPQSPGGSFVYVFRAAGNYQIACTINPSMTALIKIPLIVTPLNGSQATRFTVTWAVGKPPAEYVYDVRIQRPGAGWTTWQDGVTTASDSFVPDSGAGTYLFDARIRNAGNGNAGWYSDDVPVVVS